MVLCVRTDELEALAKEMDSRWNEAESEFEA
jgi:hypothetical protein